MVVTGFTATLAGGIVAEVLQRLQEEVRPGVTTAALDARAEEIIRQHDAIPTFLGYPHTGKNDFPASIYTLHEPEAVADALRAAGFANVDLDSIGDELMLAIAAGRT